MSLPEPHPERPPLHADARGHFIGSLGFENEIGEESSWGAVNMTPFLSVPGSNWPIASTLLTFADVLVGRLASERTAPRISITSDLNVRLFSPVPADGRIDMRAVLIKTGRTISIGETEFRSSDGAVLGRSLGTFQASPRPTDEAPGGLMPRPERFAVPAQPLAEPFTERVGLEVLEPGVTRMGLREDLVNATESLQGGLVSLLGEMAAQTAATAAAGRQHAVDLLDVRYLAAARVGPFVARAEIETAGPDRSLLRTEVRDPGRDGRLCAVVLTGTRAVA